MNYSLAWNNTPMTIVKQAPCEELARQYVSNISNAIIILNAIVLIMYILEPKITAMIRRGFKDNAFLTKEYLCYLYRCILEGMMAISVIVLLYH
jgi:hypothetical protein